METKKLYGLFLNGIRYNYVLKALLLTLTLFLSSNLIYAQCPTSSGAFTQGALCSGETWSLDFNHLGSCPNPASTISVNYTIDGEAQPSFNNMPCTNALVSQTLTHSGLNCGPEIKTIYFEEICDVDGSIINSNTIMIDIFPVIQEGIHFTLPTTTCDATITDICSGLEIEYSIDNGASFTSTPPVISPSFTPTTVNYSIFFDSVLNSDCATTGSYQVTCPLPCLIYDAATCYVEDFDAAQTSTSCNSGISEPVSGWINTGDREWNGDIGGTGSQDTGPSTDVTGQNNSGSCPEGSTGTQGTYIYAETSSGCAGDFILQSQCFDLSSASACTNVSFWYHAYGDDIGSFDFEYSIDNGLSWTSLLNITGQVQTDELDLWNLVSFPVMGTPLMANDVQFRFFYTSVTEFNGDFAIDQFRICDAAELIITASAKTVCSAATASVTNGTSTLDAGPGFASYLWSTGETTQTIDVAAGTYSVTASNASGCDVTGSFEVCEEICPCTPPTITTTVYCPLGDGNFSIDVAVTDIGALNSAYTVDVNGPQTNISAIGTYTYGPFTAGTLIDVLISGVDDTNCGYTEFNLTNNNVVCPLPCLVYDAATCYVENFDAAQTSTNCNSGIIEPVMGWTNIGSLQWNGDLGGTGSTNTGPSTDVTGQNNSGSCPEGSTGSEGIYMYTENSGCTGDFILQSRCFDLSSASACTNVSFWYHAYGADIGTFDFEYSIDNGASWTSLLNITGQVQADELDPWILASFPVMGTPLMTNDVQFRFFYNVLTTFNGDFAIDEFRICDATELIITASAKTVCSAATAAATNGTSTLDAGPGFASYLWSTGETTQTIDVAAGTYSVTASNASGCGETGSFEVCEEICPCTPPTITTTVYCPLVDGNFFIDVEVTNIGALNTAYTVDVNGPQTNISAIGTFTYGPFVAGTLIDVLISGVDDTNCGYTEFNLTSNSIICPLPCLIYDATTCYVENFDAAQTSTSCNSGITEPVSGWTNTGGLEWNGNSGTTGSANTGPSTDVTGQNSPGTCPEGSTGSEGIYMYTENSGCTGDFILQSRCFDLSSASACTNVSFWYHAYGADIGTFDFEYSIDNGLSWTSLLNITGQVQTDELDPWILASFPVMGTPLMTNDVQFRFFYNVLTTFNGDFAIDEFKICDASELNITASAKTICSAATAAATNGTSTLDAGPGFASYLWSTGETTQTIEVIAGTYSATATSTAGCSATGSFEVCEEICPCTPPTIATTVYCPLVDENFFIDVEVTDFGALNSAYTVDVNGPQTNITAIGTYTYGPFVAGTFINVLISGVDDNNCGYTEFNLTSNTTVCPLPCIIYDATTCYVENFDAAQTSTSCNSGITEPITGWTNTGGREWNGESGLTTSDDTGPSTDVTGQNSPETCPEGSTGAQGTYIYAETSSGCSGDFILESRCFDLSNVSACTNVSFWYHAYGDDIGSFDFEYSLDNGLSWTSLLNIIGQVQTDELDPWNLVSFPVMGTPLMTNDVQFRFFYTSVTSFNGDFAIDEFKICDASELNITASAKTVCSAATAAATNGTSTLDAGLGFTSYLWSTGETTQTIDVAAGTYSVIASNAAGCNATGSFEVCEEICSCTPPTIAAIALCQTGDESNFYIELNVTDIGALNTAYTLDIGGPQANITAIGLYTYGPFPQGTPVDVLLVGVDDPNCGYSQLGLSLSATPLSISADVTSTCSGEPVEICVDPLTVDGQLLLLETNDNGALLTYDEDPLNNGVFTFDTQLLPNISTGINNFGMDLDPVSGLIYIASGTQTNRELYSYDLGTNTLTGPIAPIISSTGNNKIQAITFDSVGNLWGMFSNSAGGGGGVSTTSDLELINTSTGIGTATGIVLINEGGVGLTWDFDNNVLLYTTDSGTPDIYSVDPVSGTSSLLFTLSIPFGLVTNCTAQGLEYFGGGMIYATSTQGCNILYTIDLNNAGATTLVFNPSGNGSNSTRHSDIIYIPGNTTVDVAWTDDAGNSYGTSSCINVNPFSTSTFTGSYVNELGCESSESITIDVNVLPTCTDSNIEITDPCSCNNPNNQDINGDNLLDAEEVIGIAAPAGEVWSLSGIAGGATIYDPTGAPLSTGLTATEVSPGIYEFILFYPADGSGFGTLTFSSPLRNDAVISKFDGAGCDCPCMGTISGVLSGDQNCDEVVDLGEVLIGVTLELQDGICTPGVDCPTAVTDGTGQYVFANVNCGAYDVVIDQSTLNCPTQTLIGSPGTAIINQLGGAAPNINFAFAPICDTDGGTLDIFRVCAGNSIYVVDPTADLNDLYPLPYISSPAVTFNWYLINTDGSKTPLVSIVGTPYYSPTVSGNYLVEVIDTNVCMVFNIAVPPPAYGVESIINCANCE